ncbi:MAG: hypothetical protein RIA10_14620 [Amphiplicatus sp.]
MGDEFTLEDVLIILRRRFLLFLIPALALFAIGATVVLLLPAQYTAQGTILVESAQIPDDYVRSTINAYAQERIQTIKQRVMTRDRLLSVSDKFNVFPRDKGYTDSDRVTLMRERLKVSLIKAEGSRNNGQRDGTIAFTVSYTDPSADAAYRVANEFMTLFLSEDVRTRTAGASNTTEFFKQETARLAASVDAIEESIAKFKAENADALPEHLDMHLSALERTNRDLASSEAEISSLNEELRFLETQLMSHLAGATTADGPAKELTALKAELVRLRTVYTDAHPSVKGVKDQIAALERELAPNKEMQDLQRQVAAAEVDLRKAERDLQPDDPALAQMRADAAALQKKLGDRIAAKASATGGDFLSAQIQGRIAVANNRRNLLEGQIDQARATASDLERRIAKTPQVERGLQALTRNQENMFKEYQAILAKQQDAQLAENLEDNQKAEKFSILESAMRPDKSSSPDRPKMIVLVLFVALAAGGACAIGAEFLFQTVRGRNHLTNLIEAHPIAVIPYISDGEQRFRMPAFRGRGAKASAAAAAAAALVATTGGSLEPPAYEDNINVGDA